MSLRPLSSTHRSHKKYHDRIISRKLATKIRRPVDFIPGYNLEGRKEQRERVGMPFDEATATNGTVFVQEDSAGALLLRIKIFSGAFNDEKYQSRGNISSQPIIRPKPTPAGKAVEKGGKKNEEEDPSVQAQHLRERPYRKGINAWNPGRKLGSTECWTLPSCPSFPHPSGRRSPSPIAL